MATPLTIDHLRRYAISRSLFKPTTLSRAIARLGFVQLDPIRAPARAQDLTLRHRVDDYHAGDLEARYPRLAVEEDFFVNYGILPRNTQQLMHPRTARKEWSSARWEQAQAVLEFVKSGGVVHPREVDAAFQHGTTKNWFGGNSRASTQLLDGMHYRGLLRVARREAGVRLYAPSSTEAQEPVAPDMVLDVLIDVVVAKYAPLPAATLGRLISSVCSSAVPQWRERRGEALARARARLPQATVDGSSWFWPVGDNPGVRRFAHDESLDEKLRLLAPFDPIVWDRDRFERFWGWAYRFEAYTPARQRVRGYYALPMLWRGQVIGWANATIHDGALVLEPGYVSGRAPKEAGFKSALQDEQIRLERFLSLDRA
ncbi:crosslink repair DNA glycosylase YcaQ family protein [Pseudohongiella sp. SYSU M77423]|uniref:DNA glycosylase AlkZ-like family protein n=1 Tax=Pseudohongiella sp. SYSU M77423 TaxID=3042312 RepID=UPI002480F3E4|nr:crosslink repair DNA glycosylase YcaQ family protein [Pseudohongiella sp. SYSU M77423]MDH7943722.1 crosslink repair DNA glycosylase YcaQ family protein [Pseudohongiella sp. SYSU M77423]